MTRGQLARFIKVRNESGFTNNLAFMSDAKFAGFDIAEFGQAHSFTLDGHPGYQWLFMRDEQSVRMVEFGKLLYVEGDPDPEVVKMYALMKKAFPGKMTPQAFVDKINQALAVPFDAPILYDLKMRPYGFSYHFDVIGCTVTPHVRGVANYADVNPEEFDATSALQKPEIAPELGALADLIIKEVSAFSRL